MTPPRNATEIAREIAGQSPHKDCDVTGTVTMDFSRQPVHGPLKTYCMECLRQDIAAAIEAARAEGFEAGLREYAWWKDGVEYVGTTGTTLKQAIARARGTNA